MDRYNVGEYVPYFTGYIECLGSTPKGWRGSLAPII